MTLITVKLFPHLTQTLHMSVMGEVCGFIMFDVTRTKHRSVRDFQEVMRQFYLSKEFELL